MVAETKDSESGVVDLPPDHPVTQLNNEVYAHVASYIGRHEEKQNPPTIHTATFDPLKFVAAVTFPHHRVVFNTKYAATLFRTAERKGLRWNINQQHIISALIHEHLHLLGQGRQIYLGKYNEIDANIEEAIVEAIVRDITPMVIKRLSGRKSSISPYGYPKCAKQIQLASMVGVFQPFTSKQAISWRINLLHAGPEQRRNMLHSTGTNSNDVCVILS
jgi:hypothetical protein